jgi:hypothetical protein
VEVEMEVQVEVQAEFSRMTIRIPSVRVEAEVELGLARLMHPCLPPHHPRQEEAEAEAAARLEMAHPTHHRRQQLAAAAMLLEADQVEVAVELVDPQVGMEMVAAKVAEAAAEARQVKARWSSIIRTLFMIHCGRHVHSCISKFCLLRQTRAKCSVLPWMLH